MARHQAERHFAARHLPWLVVVLAGALPGCGSETTAKTTAKSSVAPRGENASPPAGTSEDVDGPAVSPTDEVIVVPDPTASDPVTVVMAIRPRRAAVGDTVELQVHIRIARAHFIHAANDAGAPFIPVAVQMTLPEGIEAIGDWQLPTPEKGHGSSLVYRNAAVLRRSLKIASNSSPEISKLSGEVHYQVCTDELCWPQGKLELSAPLTILSHPR